MNEHPTADEPAGAAALLAGEIRRLRRGQELSQQQLATEIGYTRQYVSLAERVGRNLPSQDLIRVLDARLAAGGKLVDLREQARAEQRDRRRAVCNQASHGPRPFDGGPAASQASWRTARTYLIQHRSELAATAVALYEPSWRLPYAPMLTTTAWAPACLVPLENIRLEWEAAPGTPLLTGQEPEAQRLLPQRVAGRAFPSYSSAIRYIDPPHLLENRPCYRLLDARFTTEDGQAAGTLRFGQSTYFDKIDISEALGHELAMATMRDAPAWPELPFRSLIADPFDLALRTVNTSISTLTIRHDVEQNRATFFLLRRDPAKVATGGGQYGLVPAGEFQPASISPQSVRADLDVWRNIVREYSEELLGQPEHDGSSGKPVDYQRWPFSRAMQQARDRQELRIHVLGIALNALSLNATIMTVAVINSSAFDRLFRDLAPVNGEGSLAMTDAAGHYGLSFTDNTVGRFLTDEPLLSPHATGVLALAWRHRQTLLRLDP